MLFAVAISLALLTTRPVHAEIPPEWLGLRIVEVRVAGEQAGRIDGQTLGVPTGSPLTRALLRDTLERLGREERWADIQIDARPEAGGVVLYVHLTPRLVALRVEVAGNSVLEDREITRIVGVREGGELELERIPGFRAELKRAYEERGYYEAKIDIVPRDTDDPARKVVHVDIAEGEPTRITAITFAGDTLPRRKGLSRVLGFRVGDVADQSRIRDGLTRTEELLRRGGYYGAELSAPRIERDGRNAQVIVPSRVGPQYEVRFHGNGPLSESELFSAMALTEERLTGDANLRALEVKLKDIYHRYGFRDATVQITSRFERRVFESKVSGRRYEEPTMVLDVSIETRAQTDVERITFPGAKHYDAEFLREQVYSYLEEDLPGSTVQRPVDSDAADRLGFGSTSGQARRDVPRPMLLDPRRMFHAPTYEQAMEHVRSLYRGDGYLDVTVGPLELTELDEPGHVVVAIPIAEGPRTFIFEVLVQGNDEISSRELLSASGLVRGAPFSSVKLEEARLRIVEAYQERGYFYVRVEPSLRLSDDGTRAEIAFHVEEGYRVRVGEIIVRGHERSNESMIRNRVRLVPGELYRPSAARATQDALLSLDVFTSVTVAPEEAELPARVKNVVVSVTERKSQWLGWSTGFSTGEGVRGGVEYGYRNLFGSALHTTFRGQLGYQFVFLDREIEERYESLTTAQRIEYQTTLTVFIPYIPYLPKNTASVDLTVLQDIQRDFRMQKESVVGSFVYRPTKRLTFTLAEELEASYFRLFETELNNTSNLPTSAIVPEGANTLASTQLTAAVDLRDRTYNPRKGMFVSLTSEWAHTLEDKESMEVVFKSNLLRFIGNFAFYVPLFPKLTFASQWRYGRIVHLEADSKSYPNRLFYLGGTNFRGYYQNQVVPQDLKEDPEFNADDVVSHGGQTFIAGQNELRFPLVGDLYGGLFSDIGNLWLDPKKLDFQSLLVVVGAGLRFQTPVASLAFDYGVRAARTGPFEMAGAFQFAFQTF